MTRWLPALLLLASSLLIALFAASEHSRAYICMLLNIILKVFDLQAQRAGEH